jgi:Lon protease-like protein
MGELAERFPLFPLGLVLLPSEVVPLHIFEERYKRLVGDCLEQQGEFGIVWLSDSGLRETGCSADITKVLERLDDGRMNILVSGGRPFRLLRRIDEMAYPAGEVEFLDDDEADSTVDPELVAETHERYSELVERATDERPDGDGLAALGAYGMAATIELEPDVKQELLELRSESQRMRRVSDLIAATSERIDSIERTQAVARTNGHIRP